MSSEFIKSLCALDSLKVSISGVRGIFGHDLNLSDIIKFCQNFSLLIKSKKCVVGQDTRPSSKIVSEVVIASLMERGIDVYDLDRKSTRLKLQSQFHLVCRLLLEKKKKIKKKIKKT